MSRQSSTSRDRGRERGREGLGGLALLSPRLSALRAVSPRDTIGLLRQGIHPEALSRSPSRTSRTSRTSSCSRFLSVEEEERLALQGARERVRSEARARREQLREAQRLQAEQELLQRQQRRAAEREVQKRLLEQERFEQWRKRLEKRDMSRASLWEKSPGFGDRSASPSPRPSRGPSRGPSRATSASPSPRPSQAMSPRLSMSSSLSALLSPRERLASWDLNIASYSREEVQQLETERHAALADKEFRVLQDRELRRGQSVDWAGRRDRLMSRRTVELEAVRQAREEKRLQEMQKRRRDRDLRIEQRQMRRAGDVGTKEYEERTLEMKLHQQRERKVYQKQQAEQQAEERRLQQQGQKELQIQQARWRHERDREMQQKQRLLDHAAKEREAEALRDAREAWKEELRRRKIQDLELKRAKVLAVKADLEQRRKKKEEEKAYVYTSPPRASDKVKAAAAEAMAEWDAQFSSLSDVAATAMPAG